MAKKYDVVVVGAGPAGLLAAKAAGENGLDVALLDRKKDISSLTRACGQTLVSMNEYLFGDLCTYNARDRRICFPVNGFSFKYDGAFRRIYACHFYTPNGHLVELGDLKTQRDKGEHGAVGIAIDKERLLACLLEEVRDCGVEVFSGVNVDRVIVASNGVTVGGSQQSFEGSYCIAADGVNSRVAQMVGFDEGRYYYCNFYGLSCHAEAVKPSEPDVIVYSHVCIEGGGAMVFLLPRPADGHYSVTAGTVDPGVNLAAACERFMKKEFCSPWFRDARISRVLSAACNCYSPIIEPFRNNVLVAGDAASTQELENTGAMISGWKAGQAVSTALRERNLELRSQGISQYMTWWKQAYVDSYNHETYLKTWAVTQILSTEEEISYVFGLLQQKLRPCWNPYTSPLAQGLREVMAKIQRDRPELVGKLKRMSSPAPEIFRETTAISKPVS